MVSFIAIFTIAYVAICFLLFVFQRQMIYSPTSEVSVQGVAHTVLDTGEVRIKVWTLNPGKEKALIYFGGNAENVAYNIDDFGTLFADRTVYLVNYRGYGAVADHLMKRDFTVMHYSPTTISRNSILRSA